MNAHANADYVLNQDNVFADIDKNGPLKEFGIALKPLGTQKAGILKYSVAAGHRIAGLAPIAGTTLTLGVVADQAEVLQSITSITIVICVIALIMILLGIFAAVFLGNMISKPIRKIKDAADQLALGDADVLLEVTSNDEVGELTKSMIAMADGIKQQSEAGARIAKGDLSIEVIPRSDKDILSISMVAVVKNLRALVEESRQLTDYAVNGELSNRGNAEAFEGGFREIVAGVNETLDAVIGPLNVAADYMDRISKGDIPEVITDEYKGDFDLIKNNINTCIGAVNALVEDMNDLSVAAIEGRLSTRANAGKHSGDFAKVVEGVNATLDAVIGPLQVAASYIEQIGKGQIPEKITDNYNGDFDSIKLSVNGCIDGLGGLSEGKEILGRMSNNDYTQKVEGEYHGIYREMGESINSVSDRVNHVIEIINRVALGNLIDLDDLKKIGKRSDNDKLMPSVILMIETIKDLVAETRILSENAVKGNLSARGNTEKFSGEYGNVIEGINSTLDAVIAPVQEASAVLQEIAKGNLHVKMEGDYKGDHADIKNALNETVDNLQSYVGEISAVLSEMGNGNMDQNITAEYKGDFVEIKDSLNNISISLSQILGEINQAADQVASGARQVSDASQALSQGSTEQASTLEELTASITEIANQTKQNAMSANQANDLAGSARENGVKGNEQMKGMLKSMVEIDESSANISKIIKVIDDIAFQTNILALNAAVEAARAGQHGKGFAVVAEEVRNLAARSAEAAKETTSLIEGSISKVDTGTKLANATADALNDIADGIEKSATLVGSIANASNEQASGIAQINMGIEQVSQVVQNNSATAEEAAAASEELSGQAELLKEMVGGFKLRGGDTSKTKLLGNSAAGKSAKPAKESKTKIILDENEFDKY